MPNEKIEWSYGWNEDADTEKARCLLIGDSIVWGSRVNVYQALPKDLTLSTFATSKGVDSLNLVEEIELFCRQSEFHFEAVYFNNGLHPHGQSPEEYGKNYRLVLSRLRTLLPNAKWILGLSTPISPEIGGDPSAYSAPIEVERREMLADANRLVCSYNEQIRTVAQEEQLPCFDAYALMASHSDKKTDPYHYDPQGRQIFGAAVAEQLVKYLKKEI